MVALAMLVQEEFSSMTKELEAVSLPHGERIFIPDRYWRKLIMERCKFDKDMYSSRLMLERTLKTVHMPRAAAKRDVEESIVKYWSLTTTERAELEARYQGLTS
ncbi:hypothetical protein COU14_00075 [Candidatus Kaiserbacteria bacterium CG10_big_fil_rev_8_21_14_0_10_44_10]|uniref:Uncharacterized protein n=1 Tax=Candidatus Kaiserbacteria bacterium CG10_big_fil_rev_8_21_14_0_10_44_10 TaxID=1974606 RepID=A0A2H0UIL1_9BACT|nr:MAG: hypothetical protein COU14_00075 [Candidatus Kaiserbacteria bacterium CG10_big_fil_rev_8_21_14_0_10_44_10]